MPLQGYGLMCLLTHLVLESRWASDFIFAAPLLTVLRRPAVEDGVLIPTNT